MIALLFLCAVAVLVVGLVKPRLVLPARWAPTPGRVLCVYGVLVVLLVIAMGATMGVTAPPRSGEVSSSGSALTGARPATVTSPATVTKEMYERLVTGMSYSEVLYTMGQPGEEMNRSELAGFTTTMYRWMNRDASNLLVTIQNDKLVLKAQHDLK